MYRYNIDNAVTYTPDDLDLFRESPFAVWMERLTLENPDHGIPPDWLDDDQEGAGESADSIVETLRAEGRQVAAIDQERDESERRAATLDAMRNGADFIVNGQLAAGAFSGRAALLMRTSGYSDLGDFLYIPCAPEAADTFHSGFRLSFIANLLHSLQGQLPPQMLIIREGADVVPLPTEDHIHYYRAVQERFERAMHAFRKHRMPDPSESSRFGRWSACASEVLKQRALRELSRTEEAVAEVEEEAVAMPALRVATGALGPQGAYDSAAPRAEFAVGKAGEAAASRPGREPGHTLAEQARMLEPGSFRVGAGPGHTPNLARFPRSEAGDQAAAQSEPPQAAGVEPETDTGRSDASLENLEFIGRRSPADPNSRPRDPDVTPPPSLRPAREPQTPQAAGPDADHIGEQPGRPRFLPPDATAAPPSPPPGERFPDLGSARPGYRGLPAVDLDSAPAPTLAPARGTGRQAGTGDEGRRVPQQRPRELRRDDESGGRAPSRPFDDRLNTSGDFGED